MDISIFSILLIMILVFNVLPFALRAGKALATFNLFAFVMAVYTTVTLLADGSLTVAYLNNSGTVVPVTQGISTIIYVPVFLAFMSLGLMIHRIR